MRIVVDSDIWGAETLFAELGDVVSLPASEIRPAHLNSADALIVRSVTRVDESLLAGSPVRFVGTATTGTDHVDHEYLRRGGIVLAAAEGCNARPVVEYVVSCLFEWRRRTGRPLNQSVLGVIGRGRIGRGVADWGAALGMRVLAADPPLARAGRPGLCTLEQLLIESDIITLHVPLTHDGIDATRGLIESRRLDQMKRGAWLVNAARGRVVVDADLIAALDAQRLGGAILDVWSGEPVASQALLRATTLLTPHIAGYSAGAHRRAAQRIAARLSNWMNGRDDQACDGGMPDADKNANTRQHQSVSSALNETDMEIIEDFVRQACNVSAIDVEYRQKLKNGAAAEAFDSVRVACRSRRELTDLTLSGVALSSAAAAVLEAWSVAMDDRPSLG